MSLTPTMSLLLLLVLFAALVAKAVIDDNDEGNFS